jgi:DNA-binding transcriptional LysR family regulator
VEQALAELERAIDEACADRGAGPLRVTMLAFFLAQWLLPRLSKFTSQHPGIDVQIHTPVDLADFVATGTDAGIRFGAGAWPRLHSEKMFDEWLVPVCAPVLLRRHGPVAHAEDLSGTSCFTVLMSPGLPGCRKETRMRCGRRQVLRLTTRSPLSAPPRPARDSRLRCGVWWRMTCQ